MPQQNNGDGIAGLSLQPSDNKIQIQSCHNKILLTMSSSNAQQLMQQQQHEALESMLIGAQ